MYPRPEDFDMLPIKTQDAWNDLVNRVSVIGFNSSMYDINMIERYFEEKMAED